MLDFLPRFKKKPRLTARLVICSETPAAATNIFRSYQLQNERLNGELHPLIFNHILNKYFRIYNPPHHSFFQSPNLLGNPFPHFLVCALDIPQILAEAIFIENVSGF